MITEAPRSARIAEQNGPGTNIEKSATRTPASGSQGSLIGASFRSGPGALRRQALARLRAVDDEARVRAAPDVLDILHRQRNHNLPPVDLDDFHFQVDGESQGRRRQVVDHYLRADRVLAGVEVGEQPVAAA